MVKIRWLGANCFQIIFPENKTLIIDPYIDNSLTSPIHTSEIEKCDWIFITHGHYDHALDAGKLFSRHKCKIYCNGTTASTLITIQNVLKEFINTVNIGDRINLNGVKVKVLAGHHTNFENEYKRVHKKDPPSVDSFKSYEDYLKFRSKFMHGTEQIPDFIKDIREKYKGGEQLMFLIEHKSGTRIFVAATHPTQEIIEFSKSIDSTVTLLQCPLGNRLIGIENEVAKIAINSKSKIVIPCHHDPLYPGGAKTDLSLLKSILENKGITFLELSPGKWYYIKK